MKLSLFTISLVLTTASLHGALGAEQCGVQAGGALCPNSLCCSKWGFCGSTDTYCGSGCQSQCTPPPQCGRQAGGVRCPNGLCCSQWGFCGITGPFCDNCQLGQCHHPPMCGRQVGGAGCPHGLCCSQWGYCGNTAAYCGQGCQSQCSNPPRCGRQAGGALCPHGHCCSSSGYCGRSLSHCGNGCQSQCARLSRPLLSWLGGGGVASIISSALFDELLKHRNDAACPARGFYRYEDFIAAADAFAGFGTTGDLDTRKREIAAFLAETSHHTAGVQPSPQDGPYAWGYCSVEEGGATTDYCALSTQWPCAPGKKYFGRGPIQISYNYKYGPAGEAIGVDLLNNPDLVATDPTVSFKTAIWFWMTPQSPEPSCHDAITGRRTTNGTDVQALRLLGYEVITNIINGRLECGRGIDSRVESRIGFYKRYCDILGVSYGDNLNCFDQEPLASA